MRQVIALPTLTTPSGRHGRQTAIVATCTQLRAIAPALHHVPAATSAVETRLGSKTRLQIVHQFARGLLACNDAVIFTDIDQFLLADPAYYASPPEHLSDRRDTKIVAPSPSR